MATKKRAVRSPRVYGVVSALRYSGSKRLSNLDMCEKIEAGLAEIRTILARDRMDAGKVNPAPATDTVPTASSK